MVIGVLQTGSHVLQGIKSDFPWQNDSYHCFDLTSLENGKSLDNELFPWLSCMMACHSACDQTPCSFVFVLVLEHTAHQMEKRRLVLSAECDHLCLRKTSWAYLIPKSKIWNASNSKVFEHQHDVTSGKLHTMKPCFMHKIVRNIMTFMLSR